MKKFIILLSKITRYKRIYLVFLSIFGLVLTFLASFSEKLVENFFSTKIYKFFVTIIGFITSLFKFSVGEILLYLIILSFIAYIVFNIIKLINEREKKDIILKFISTIFASASVIYFLFVISCGLNYYREPFVNKLGLKVRNSSVDELYNLCDLLIIKAKDVRETLKEDKNSVAVLYDKNIYNTAKIVGEEYYLFSKKYKALEGIKIIPKPVISSEFMSKCNIVGVFSPFTFEANVNVRVPAFTIPASMFHELSHVKGVMREDEANFIAFLTCINSKNNDFIYSGLLLALSYSMDELYNNDIEKFNKLRGQYSSKMNSDMDFEYKYWEKYQDKILDKVSNTINNSYLKGNNQPEGVKTYGFIVDLLLAYYRK